METLKAWAVTSWPKHHFFGHSGLSPWDATGRYLLCLEADFQDHFPAPHEAAGICLVDTENGSLERLAETRAWNFQQGAKLRWLPPGADSRIAYNERQGDRYVTVTQDVRTGQRRVLPRAFSELSHDGQWALCISFSRLRNHYPGIGYAGIEDPYATEPYPSHDGIYRMEMASGHARLILSYEQVREYHSERSEMDGRPLWFSHATYNTDSSRFCFLSRYRPAGQTRWKTALFTANPDGNDLRCLLDYGHVSHLDWRDPHVLLVFANVDREGEHYYLVDSRSGEAQVVAEDLTCDGHCTFSNDRRWFLTDTYPDQDNLRSLLLWNLEEEREVPLGRYYSDPNLSGEILCDLPPRWSRDNRWVCFDSVHEGSRQVYLLEVAAILGL